MYSQRLRTAHPRSRGENALVIGVLKARGGSSPLTRGKPGIRLRSWRRSGLIPAHAGKTHRSSTVVHPGRAHPRSRGENQCRRLRNDRDLGSSPLTRGKLLQARERRPGGRLIPAHAGKTPTDATTDLATGAHPRSRGENLGFSWPMGRRSGSSPLTRGKPDIHGGTHGRARLIPAHAGKTGGPAGGHRHAQAHPRSRGENSSARKRPASASGSSPLTRGKQPIQVGALGSARLIPAHAGKTHPGSPPARPPQAHPRSRGENAVQKVEDGSTDGSSPLTRGKRFCALSERGRARLIPAHAGKTVVAHAPASHDAAHPRSRGENDHLDCPAHHILGSSPLTRGKRVSRSRRTAKSGLIPAHAGKTRSQITGIRGNPAHPRSRGENGVESLLAGVGSGSSPLTRGKQGHLRDPAGQARLIPAHAGKTKRSDHTDPGPAAHPRSRGENRVPRRRWDRDRGSSPLTRGKPPDHRRHSTQEGLIPAHAGKTLPDLRFYCADRSDLGNP